MHTLEKIKLNIIKEINKILGRDLVQIEDLVFPPNPEMGDLSLVCFNIGKKAGKSPAEAAGQLARELSPVLSAFGSAKAVGPYLNFIFNKNYLAKNVLAEIAQAKEKYGSNKSGKGKKVMIEYSNANTHKEYHIGHLRNICFGDAVYRILAANGYKAIPVSYINDFGIHVAKVLWMLETTRYNKEPSFEASELGSSHSKGYILGKLYSQAVAELENNDLGKQMVAFMMKKIEGRMGEEYKLWQKTRKWNIEYMDKIYKELGVKFSHIFYESEVIDRGKKMVDDLLRKGFLTKSEGAIIADLNKYNLGVVVFLRADGTALYPVADIPLAIEKFKKYKLDKSIYVVDIRQSLYFKQLFKIMGITGFKKEMLHLGYEFVKLPSGTMSSRTGNVITYEDLRAPLLERAISETKKRHNDWSERKIKEVAGKLINGAMKFEMIKVSREQVITFDISQSLRFDGFTAAYLQYTYARINSIIKKSEVRSKKFKVDFNNLAEKQEHELIVRLAKYPEVIIKAEEDYNPAEIAKYLFELAREFNEYYHSVPVLKTKKEVRRARLVLISAVSQVIVNGLGLLGIEVVAEM